MFSLFQNSRPSLVFKGIQGVLHKVVTIDSNLSLVVSVKHNVITATTSLFIIFADDTLAKSRKKTSFDNLDKRKLVSYREKTYLLRGALLKPVVTVFKAWKQIGKQCSSGTCTCRLARVFKTIFPQCVI